jgi:hypothetical protein
VWSKVASLGGSKHVFLHDAPVRVREARRRQEVKQRPQLQDNSRATGARSKTRLEYCLAYLPTSRMLFCTGVPVSSREDSNQYLQREQAKGNTNQPPSSADKGTGKPAASSQQ